MRPLVHIASLPRYLRYILLILALLPSGGLAAGPAGDETLPGALAHPPELQARLRQALAERGPGYVPRTEHLRPDGQPRYTNRLLLEASPYLRQHAHNPVDWYPWGPEAFARARRENRPIFLSIGYSTCHWCHVMERESFENIEIARYLNAHFIAIKVDRERRPDVDATYMMAVMLMRGSGGWPMTSFLTPEGETFFGATYLPPKPLMELAKQVAERWAEDPKPLIENARRVTSAVQQAMAAGRKAGEVGEEEVRRAVDTMLGQEDTLEGGFGQAPKFPHEAYLFLLLEHAAQGTRGGRPLRAAERALTAMARGGIYDQIGGGFHRYSTDSHWLVPHFEKMLYNQANLARAYLEAYRLTARPAYARIVRQTLDYVLRDMQAPEGGFWSATDADSDGREGAFYVWTPEQVRAALPPEDAALALEVYGITEAGNFEGASIPHIAVPLERYAQDHGLELESLLARLDRVREALRKAREARPRPGLDAKVVTAWNGMMILTLLEAGVLLNEPRYTAAAHRAAKYIWDRHWRREEGLWRASLDGHAEVPATQPDYAWYALALLALYEHTELPRWKARGDRVVDKMIEKFWDPEHGGFFMGAAQGDTPRLARARDSGDHAIPAGSSVAFQLLSRLERRRGTPALRERAEAVLASLSRGVRRQPSAYAYLLAAVEAWRRGEPRARRYAAHGGVRIDARPVTDPKDPATLSVRLTLRIGRGLHINAHQPLDPDLIPTELTVEGAKGAAWELLEVQYPKPLEQTLGFSKAPLALYLGEVEIEATLRRSATPEASGGLALAPLRLRLQACTQKACMAPESVSLRVSPVGVLH